MEILGIKEHIAHLLIGEATQTPGQKKEKEGSVEERPPSEAMKTVFEGNEESLQAVAERINQSLKSMSYSLQFVPDKESGVVVIKVLDEKGKVIRQIPPEVMVELFSKIGNKGLIFNKILP
jgi:uncharacterized FlaG/YvyC family protein